MNAAAGHLRNVMGGADELAKLTCYPRGHNLRIGNDRGERPFLWCSRPCDVGWGCIRPAGGCWASPLCPPSLSRCWAARGSGLRRGGFPCLWSRCRWCRGDERTSCDSPGQVPQNTGSNCAETLHLRAEKQAVSRRRRGRKSPNVPSNIGVGQQVALTTTIRYTQTESERKDGEERRYRWRRGGKETSHRPGTQRKTGRLHALR